MWLSIIHTRIHAASSALFHGWTHSSHIANSVLRVPFVLNHGYLMALLTMRSQPTVCYYRTLSTLPCLLSPDRFYLSVLLRPVSKKPVFCHPKLNKKEHYLEYNIFLLKPLHLVPIFVIFFLFFTILHDEKLLFCIANHLCFFLVFVSLLLDMYLYLLALQVEFLL